MPVHPITKPIYDTLRELHWHTPSLAGVEAHSLAENLKALNPRNFGTLPKLDLKASSRGTVAPLGVPGASRRGRVGEPLNFRSSEHCDPPMIVPDHQRVSVAVMIRSRSHLTK
eukprot:110305-Hanusia_phi.AAC.2